MYELESGDTSKTILSSGSFHRRAEDQGLLIYKLKSGSLYGKDKVQWIQMDKVKFRRVSAGQGAFIDESMSRRVLKDKLKSRELKSWSSVGPNGQDKVPPGLCSPGSVYGRAKVQGVPID